VILRNAVCSCYTGFVVDAYWIRLRNKKEMEMDDEKLMRLKRIK
jgi:hypothetical protein